MTEAELTELASQLSNPTGENGIKIADLMRDGNREMIFRGIQQLALAPGDLLLEPGHGGGAHIPQLLEQAEDIRYMGLEISADMRDYASLQCGKGGVGKAAEFLLFDGENIPLESGRFDKILTANTLYFWKRPAAFARELLRVLKPGGKLVLVFAPRHFMEKLPFTGQIFSLYEPEEVEFLLTAAGFSEISFHAFTDHVVSKSGEKVDRPFFVVEAFRS